MLLLPCYPANSNVELKERVDAFARHFFGMVYVPEFAN